jgi:SRSO17 transposase
MRPGPQEGRRHGRVQRQYTGTAGKVDNAQVAVYLAYATTAGHRVIDRELYLPRGWLADAERCQVAGVPDRVGFATKVAAGAPQPDQRGAGL